MLCEKCHERQATVHLTMINGPSRGEKRLCNVCCPLDKSEQENQATVSEFLKGMPLKPSEPLPPIVGEILIPARITVMCLASLLNQKPCQVIAELMDLGVFANLNHELDFDTASKLARKHGYTSAPA